MRKKPQKRNKQKKWRVTSPTHLIAMGIKSLWFFLVLSATSYYCVSHWESCLDLSSLGGDNVIFIIWLLLVLFPLLPGVKISAFGIDLEMEKKEMHEILELVQKATAEATLDNASNKSAEAMKAVLQAEATAIQATVQGEGKP